MYSVSEDYKNIINKNVRTPRNKIVVDGKTYTGREDLLTFPKITQETTMMIGGFPAKTVEFELYNGTGNINLLNKDVTVYRGYDIGKLVTAGETARATNVAMVGMDFSKGFSIILRGFYDATKLVNDYSRLFSSTRHTTLITQIDNPNILSAQIYTDENEAKREPRIDLSSFTKDDFLTITLSYDLTTITLTATNGKKTVTNSASRSSVPLVGTYFYIGSIDLVGNPIFEYDSVAIQTYADGKNYKFVADEMDKWKSTGDRVTYTINGKWDIGYNTEYLPMGVYRARAEEDVKNNSTNKKIVFKGTDRAVEFNKIHNSLNDPAFPCTYLDYIKNIVTSYGYELESEDFPFASTVMTQPPNITSNTTDRELISRFAEMCGGIAQMSRTGKVEISMPLKTNTRISKTYYSTLSSKEKKYGCISTVVLGRDSGEETVFDDITKVDTNIQSLPYGRNLISLRKLTPKVIQGTINSLEDNKIIMTSQENSGVWQRAEYWLNNLNLSVGTYTLHAKGFYTNSTSAIPLGIEITKYQTMTSSRTSYVELFLSRNDSVQFTIEDGYYYSISFFFSTTLPIVGTNVATYDDIYIAKEDEFSKYEPYEENGVSVWRIDNNPFLDLIRESMIDAVAENILGQSVTPFQLDDCIDDFYYNLNDIVEIQDKTGAWFETRILSVGSTGRIKTTYGAFTQEEETSYNLTGSTSETGKNVKVEVDRINAQINAINESVEGIGTKYTQTEQNFQFLFNENNEMKNYINFEDGSVVIGKVGNEFKLVQQNDRIQILQDEEATAQFLYNLFESEDMRAKKSAQVGEFIFEQDDDGVFNLEFLGGDE